MWRSIRTVGIGQHVFARIISTFGVIMEQLSASEIDIVSGGDAALATAIGVGADMSAIIAGPFGVAAMGAAVVVFGFSFGVTTLARYSMASY
jgi:hypothetical protein